MNIPRQFYGMNYLTKLIDQFQDGEVLECPKLKFHVIDDIQPKELPKVTPQQVGLNTEHLITLLTDLSNNRSCALDGIAIGRNEAEIIKQYRAPYSAKTPRITNSTCKTITAIAVMFAISENRFTEDDKVLSFFPEYETVLTPKNVKDMTVYHLLTMTSCSKCNEIASLTESDWVKAFLLSDCQCEPGSKFIYNSMNSYMLAAIVCKVTGISLMEYLKPRLFEPLGINHVKWELCPNGIERGGWGMHLSLDGMMRIGMFLANDGVFQGKKLIENTFIKRMKDVNVPQEVDKFSTGYGYQIWHLPNRFYMLSGMYGQHVIIDDTNKLVIATNAHNDKMFPDSYLVKRVIRYMEDDRTYYSAGTIVEFLQNKQLLKWTRSFASDCALNIKSKKDMTQFMQNIQQFDGKRLHIDQATVSLFPYMLRGMYQFPPFHVTDIGFRLTEASWKLCFYKEKTKKQQNREKLIIEAGFNTYIHQKIEIGDMKWNIAVKAYPAKDEDLHDVIMIDITYPDLGFGRVIKLFLLEERYGVECIEYPDMRGIIEQVIYGETMLAGTRIDLTDKLPRGIRVYLEHKVEPCLNAYLKDFEKSL